MWLPTYSNTTTGTMGTAEVGFTAVNIPAGAVIKGIWGFSLTGTYVLYQLRVDFPGIKTPQIYLLPVMNALEGTEVGAGQGSAGFPYLPVHIPIPSGVTQVTLYGLASGASQSCVAGIIWEAP